MEKGWSSFSSKWSAPSTWLVEQKWNEILSIWVMPTELRFDKIHQLFNICVKTQILFTICVSFLYRIITFLYFQEVFWKINQILCCLRCMKMNPTEFNEIICLERGWSWRICSNYRDTRNLLWFLSAFRWLHRMIYSVFHYA